MKKLFCGVLFACECFANEAILNEVGQEIVNCATHRVVEKSKKSEQWKGTFSTIGASLSLQGCIIENKERYRKSQMYKHLDASIYLEKNEVAFGILYDELVKILQKKYKLKYREIKEDKLGIKGPPPD